MQEITEGWGNQKGSRANTCLGSNWNDPRCCVDPSPGKSISCLNGRITLGWDTKDCAKDIVLLNTTWTTPTTQSGCTLSLEYLCLVSFSKSKLVVNSQRTLVSHKSPKPLNCSHTHLEWKHDKRQFFSIYALKPLACCLWLELQFWDYLFAIHASFPYYSVHVPCRLNSFVRKYTHWKIFSSVTVEKDVKSWKESNCMSKGNIVHVHSLTQPVPWDRVFFLE